MYVSRAHGSVRFRWAKSPTSNEFTQLTHTIAPCIGVRLENKGLLERDAETSYLTLNAGQEVPMNQLLDSATAYRIAVDPQARHKLFPA